MFDVESGFCFECASVLPPFGVSGFVTCYGCKKTFDVKSKDSIKIQYFATGLVYWN